MGGGQGTGIVIPPTAVPGVPRRRALRGLHAWGCRVGPKCLDLAPTWGKHGVQMGGTGAERGPVLWLGTCPLSPGLALDRVSG